MSPPASLLPSFLVSLLLVSLLAAPAAALSIQFQDSGLGQQQIDIFGPDGEYIETTNTGSVLTINGTDSPYTFKLRPAAANQDPGTLLQDLLNVLTNNILIIALILIGIFFLVRRR